ncbi:uncharacterized protein si:busm1-163l24.3 [Sardina pilchardus]|uniref:uncharacterized protein si:busm1-163l24.3 n=1 Tax=Sardina pilchardus TaxID=27697 RepID=UPI002E12CB39
MAGLGRGLHVVGLPSDVERDRLIDKLLIHFLRPSNGGGEVLSVTVSKGRPQSALVTFEDRKVALSVLHHHPHILELDGQRHELSVSLAGAQSANPDMVILTMSVTVDCHQLPLGKKALTSMQRQFPDLHISFPSPEENRCSLSGPYSQMQPAVAHILELHEHSRGENPRPEEENGFGPTASQSEQMWPGSNGPSSLLALGALGSFAGQEVENLGAEGGALGLSLPRSARCPVKLEEELKCDAEVEDLSMIMDSDLFQYLQRCKEYQQILRDYNVEVVDETSHGLTTLFFQTRSKVTEESGVPGRTLKRLARAQKELRQLQQQQEASLRRAQLTKSTLNTTRGGLSAAMENVQSLLPKLLLTQDDENVYIVGESSDVSQAKQFLTQGYHLRKEDVVTSTQSPSHSPLHTLSSASSPSDAGQGEWFDSKPTVEDPRMGKMLRTSGGDRKMEYKLAARFKSSGVTLGGLGPKPGDMSDLKDQRDLDLQRPSTKNEPLLASGNLLVGRDRLLSGGAGIDFTALHISPPERTGGDILFRGTDPQTTAAMFVPMSTKISTRTATSFSSLPLQTPLDVKTLHPPGPPPGSSGSSGLKRASSFSGRTRVKQEEAKLEAAQATSSTTRTRPRSNSITRVHSAEVIVPQLMWSHMKEAYHTRLDDMMSDLQMSESQSGADSGVKVVLKGAESRVVVTCQRELQKLVSMVTSDFSVMELRLSDLGVVEGDEVFEACCADVRSRFSKVSQRKVRGSLYLIGPKLLCSQVDAMLREVFSGGPGQKAPSQSFLKQPVSSKDGLDPDHTQRGSSSSDTEKNTNRKKDLQKGERLPSEPTESTHRRKGNTSEPTAGGLSLPIAKKEPVTREKVERAGTSGRKSKTYTSPSPSADTGQGAVARRFDEKPPSLPATLSKEQEFVKQTNLHPSPTVTTCICGESSSQLAGMACGLNLCRRCMSHHGHCQLCSNKGTERSLPNKSQDQNKNQDQALAGRLRGQSVPGIRGTMSCVELPFSLSGHARDTTAKITYAISDGIQDEGHPCPGSPFQGGVFEAYLPLSPRGRGFLPLLERAFRQGLTFTISMGNTTDDRMAKVVWHNIPHKTKMEGGKSGNGYPDSSYLSRLSEALKAHGIEDVPVTMTQDKAKP